MAKSKETQNSPEKIVKRGKGKSIPPKGGMTDKSLGNQKNASDIPEELQQYPATSSSMFDEIIDKGIKAVRNTPKESPEKKVRKGYVIAVAHNRDIVLLRSPKEEEISRRLVWKFPADFQSTLEVGQVYEVNAFVTNRRDMDFLLSTIEVISVVGLIPTE